MKQRKIHPDREEYCIDSEGAKVLGPRCVSRLPDDDDDTRSSEACCVENFWGAGYK